MKAFLLAGGRGERLAPLTDRIPKCLAPVNGVPLLTIWLELCSRHGIHEVLINVARHADILERFLAEGAWNVDIRLVREPNPIGNAGTVLAHRDFVKAEESFFIVYTDNLTDVSLSDLAAFHRTHAAPMTMALFHTPAPEASGIVQMGADHLITAFEEKPARPRGTLANAGLYVARHEVFEAIPGGYEVTDFGHDVIPRLVGHMYGYVIEDFLMDIGNPAALAEASRLWKERA